MNLTDQEASLLVQLQKGIEPVARPFESFEGGEAAVLAAARKFKEAGIVRRFGAVFDARRLGYRSSLCAVRVPQERLASVAEIVCRENGVTHAYERVADEGGDFPNFWFTLAERSAVFEKALERLAEAVAPERILVLPATKRFKIDVVFDVRTRDRDEKVEPRGELPSETAVFIPTAFEENLIRMMDGDIGFSVRPFDSVAAKLAVSEGEVLRKVAEWKSSGILRRVGLLLKHREAGFKANGMCCWNVPEEQVCDFGRRLAQFPEVTHCYERPFCPEVPFRLYAMIHRQSVPETRALFARLTDEAGLPPGRIFFSTTEFKKTSMAFFK